MKKLFKDVIEFLSNQDCILIDGFLADIQIWEPDLGRVKFGGENGNHMFYEAENAEVKIDGSYIVLVADGVKHYIQAFRSSNLEVIGEIDRVEKIEKTKEDKDIINYQINKAKEVLVELKYIMFTNENKKFCVKELSQAIKDVEENNVQDVNDPIFGKMCKLKLDGKDIALQLSDYI